MYVEDIEIPIFDDNISLKGSIYYSSKTLKKAPFIINIAGLGNDRDSKFVYYFSKKFAEAGFYVLSYDHRGHGENAKFFIKNVKFNIVKIFTDINQIITWVLKYQKNKVLYDNLILFGRSLGGAIILSHGFIDERAKILIPLCTRYDYHTFPFIKFSENIIKEISPRYFLKVHPSNNYRILTAHCRDDNIIPFNNIFKIKEHLGLSDENIIIYDSGKHSFKNRREDLFKRCIKFLKRI
ncbi:MAG: alpha/beta hydrolase family protein [Promethearchaeota archaeon]